MTVADEVTRREGGTAVVVVQECRDLRADRRLIDADDGQSTQGPPEVRLIGRARRERNTCASSFGT
ncbi:hypothetical protein AX769_00665 [Frondihabitans sp. PAMC 28766]|nr:hypothetical protein AX769_00665 [Frondihabitans sp. PAMC 28766]